jgi:hypothetical protein
LPCSFSRAGIRFPGGEDGSAADRPLLILRPVKQFSILDLNTTPAGGGVLAVSVSKKLLDSAGLKVGQSADIEVERT